MDKVKNIPANPHSVIRTINGASKNQYNQYFEQHRKAHGCECNLFCCNDDKNKKCN